MPVYEALVETPKDMYKFSENLQKDIRINKKFSELPLNNSITG